MQDDSQRHDVASFKKPASCINKIECYLYLDDFNSITYHLPAVHRCVLPLLCLSLPVFLRMMPQYGAVYDYVEKESLRKSY